MDLLDTISEGDALLESARRLEKASGWKESTQRLTLNRLKELARLQYELQNGTYQQSDGGSFVLNEYGKKRVIQTLEPRDVVAQQSICNHGLIPALIPYLIHDNGASQRGKGISFTRRRFEQHVHSFYRQHGRDGYILKIDFRKYFDNIQHDKVLEAIDAKLHDSRLYDLLEQELKEYEADVSYTSEDLYNGLFNSLEHQQVDKSKLTGQRMMRKSLGIGSPISQIVGVFLPTRIDTWVKTVKGVKYYDVYMDDRVVIHENKEYLWQLLGEIESIANELGIHINHKKTQIIPLRQGFTFLKTRYVLTESGKLIRRIPKDVATRERRKLKALARHVVEGRFTLDEFDQQYQSWRGDKKKYSAYRTLRNMDTLYRRLRQWLLQQKKSTRQSDRSSRKSSTCAAT